MPGRITFLDSFTSSGQNYSQETNVSLIALIFGGLSPNKSTKIWFPKVPSSSTFYGKIIIS
jgi:hypothetical protein